MLALSTLCLAVAGPSWPCGNKEIAGYPMCDVSLSAAVRAADLVARMNTTEKMTQLGNTVPAVPRLFVPQYEYHSEGLHGLRTVCQDIPGTTVTVYPQVTSMAATGNLSLIAEMGTVSGTEARAVNNMADAAGSVFGKGGGLNYWGPTMNIGRDPRWGRFQESVSEDPFLNGAYAYKYVKSFQDRGKEKYLKVAACCKHFYGYSLEDADGFTRHNFDAKISKRDLEETYLPAFRACTAADVAQVMCSYNAVNGVPTCLDGNALDGLRKGATGAAPFKGMIVSDCDAIGDAFNNHHYVNSSEAATALGIKAGTDMDCGGTYTKGIAGALSGKLLSTDDMDVALTRIFTMRFDLGMFDSVAQNAYRNIPTSVLASEEHIASSKRAAVESIVLLKNTESPAHLPLSAADLKGKNILVFGSQANTTEALTGAKTDYCAPFLVTAYEGLSAVAGLTLTFYSKNTTGAEFTSLLEKADLAVSVVGGLLGMESHDRTSILLPEADLSLTAMAKQKGVPTVGVIITGEPVAIDDYTKSVDSLVFAGEGGMYAGTALAEVLFGKVSPSGVLPFTIYPNEYTSQVKMDNMSMHAGPGRTYRFYQGKPTFPFGFGLTYTTWAVENVTLPARDQSATTLRETNLVFRVKVKNTGTVDAAKVVQGYISADFAGGPIKELFAMEKVFVPAGGSVDVDIHTKQIPGMCTFCTVNDNGEVAVRPGNYVITIGGEFVQEIIAH